MCARVGVGACIFVARLPETLTSRTISCGSERFPVSIVYHARGGLFFCICGLSVIAYLPVPSTATLLLSGGPGPLWWSPLCCCACATARFAFRLALAASDGIFNSSTEFDSQSMGFELPTRSKVLRRAGCRSAGMHDLYYDTAAAAALLCAPDTGLYAHPNLHWV